MMDRSSLEILRLVGDVVLWSRKVGPVTEIRFRSGRALILSDTGVTMFSPPMTVIDW